MSGVVVGLSANTVLTVFGAASLSKIRAGQTVPPGILNRQKTKNAGSKKHF